MDDIYRDIYSRLYYGNDERSLYWYPPERLGWPVEPGDLRRFIDEAQLSLERRRRIRVRPDAKFFLLVNLWQMVVLPIQLARRVPSPDIDDILSNDITFLLDEASSEYKEGEEISGHAVLDAFSRSWQKLKLSDFKLWET